MTPLEASNPARRSGNARSAKGHVEIHADECKGCALCVEACPLGGLQISRTTLNRLGYHPVEFLEVGCTGCGVCFYACPEPGALRVLRRPHRRLVRTEP